MSVIFKESKRQRDEEDGGERKRKEKRMRSK